MDAKNKLSNETKVSGNSSPSKHREAQEPLPTMKYNDMFGVAVPWYVSITLMLAGVMSVSCFVILFRYFRIGWEIGTLSAHFLLLDSKMYKT